MRFLDRSVYDLLYSRDRQGLSIILLNKNHFFFFLNMNNMATNMASCIINARYLRVNHDPLTNKYLF